MLVVIYQRDKTNIILEAIEERTILIPIIVLSVKLRLPINDIKQRKNYLDPKRADVELVKMVTKDIDRVVYSSIGDTAVVSYEGTSVRIKIY